MTKDIGWDSFLDQVSTFYGKHNIVVPNMNDTFLARSRSRRKAHEIIYLYYFRVELFYSIIDIQLQELSNRFNEVNTGLLLCMACLCPCDIPIVCHCSCLSTEQCQCDREPGHLCRWRDWRWRLIRSDW